MYFIIFGGWFYVRTQIAPNGGVPHLNLVITERRRRLLIYISASILTKVEHPVKRLITTTIALDIKLAMPLIIQAQDLQLAWIFQIFQSYPIIRLTRVTINKLYPISCHLIRWYLIALLKSQVVFRTSSRWNQKKKSKSPARLFLQRNHRPASDL